MTTTPTRSTTQEACAEEATVRVLYLIDTLNVGGTEQSLASIISRFTRTDVLVCHIYKGDDLRSVYGAAGIPVVSLDLDEAYGFFKAIGLVRNLVREWKPDIIHASLYRSGIVARLVGRLENIPVVDSFVSDSYGKARRSQLSVMQAIKLSVVRWADASTARWVTRFVSNSNAIARTNAQALRIPPSNVTVIHRGREPKLFAPGCTEPAELLGANGERVKGPLFLNVGRLLKGKGQSELIKAFALVHKRRPDAHLAIAGEGAYRKQLEERINQLGLVDHIHLLGQRSDVPALLAAASVFVFPSHYEGHSGALLEAMFAQKPIIASDIPQNRESVTHEETALLIPVSQPGALADAMLWMLENPEIAARLAEGALEDARLRFDIHRIAEKHENMYHRLVGKSVANAIVR